MQVQLQQERRNGYNRNAGTVTTGTQEQLQQERRNGYNRNAGTVITGTQERDKTKTATSFFDKQKSGKIARKTAGQLPVMAQLLEPGPTTATRHGWSPSAVARLPRKPTARNGDPGQSQGAQRRNASPVQ